MSTDKNNSPNTSQYLAAEDAAVAMMESAARIERRKKIKNRSLVQKLVHALETKASGR